MENIDSTTLSLLKEYLSNGGKIWLEGPKPEYVDGEPANGRCDFLESNIVFEDMIDPEAYISHHDTRIRSTYRKSDFGNFIFTVNLSDTESYKVDFRVEAKGAKLFDMETREYKPLYFTKTEDGIKIPLSFRPGDSFMIMLDDEAKSAKKISVDKDKKTYSFDTNATMLSATENALTVDYVSFSYDGKKYTKQMHVMAASDRLLRNRKNGKLWLKYYFTVAEMPETLYLEAEPMPIISATLNKKPLEFDEQGTIDSLFLRKDIRSLAKKGVNEIVFEIDYQQREYVYDIFNGVYYEHSGVTESLMNCLSYDTDVEAVYILGDFAVNASAGYFATRKRTSTTKGTFEIAKPHNEINMQRINQQGYPFFAGEITFDKKIFVDRTDYKLKLNGRFAIAEINVNDKFVTKLMFDNVCDLSDYLVEGENLLTIKLMNSNRNLLGPHHLPGDPDPYGLGPGTFSLYGAWNDEDQLGTSRAYCDDYAFVDFGIDSLELI